MAVAAALVLGGCAQRSTHEHSSKLPSLSTSTTTVPEVLTPSTTTTWPTGPPGWRVASVGPRGITAQVRTMTSAAGRSMTVAEFPFASTAFRLHVGSGDPPGAIDLAPVDSSNKVSTIDDERASLVAAFNGGFKRDAAAGGMIVDEIVVSTLSNGFATAVIDGKGHLDVGVWGRDVPRPGEKVIAARQNLSLLVDGGRATALAGQGAGPWGSVLGPNPVVARSAVGVNASGDVFYAGTTMALPSDLADVMVQLGAVRAMQLDINPSWVTLGIAPNPGGPMTGIVPGQYHDPSIFLNGWERDFVAVLAQPRQGCQLVFASPAGVPGADPTIVRCGSPHVRPSRDLAPAA